ncbi:alpha/beta hydrolase [Clostridia bacterium OttesenSCG-928-O13]|nr:alpha/beta hydrolase [Clostridia bacterium OttesenSCG-928-O13]
MDVRLVVNTILLALLAAGILVAGTLLGGWAGLLLAVLILAALVLAVSVFFLRLVLRRPGGVLSNVGPAAGTRTQQDAETAAYIQEKEALLAPQGWEDVSITSRDGLRLHGYYLAGAPGEKRTAVLAHGYSVRALQMADYALFWRDTYGFNVLMPDARAHGQSEGVYAGMGWPERLDYLDWFDYLLKKLGPDATFVMQGISMGGATVLTTGGENPPEALKFLIEDCGYTSAYNEFRHQMSARYHLPSIPVLPVVSLLARALAGYRFTQASPLRSASRITLPILFIHGEADNYVPTYMVHQLYNAADKAPHKEKITVPGAGHVKAFFADDSGRIRKAIHRYVESYLPPE